MQAADASRVAPAQQGRRTHSERQPRAIHGKQLALNAATMCGFVGGVLSRAVSESDVRALATAGATLAHRGPDSDGLAVIPEARTVLAFRRLAIIALADGDEARRVEHKLVKLAG
jgi:hypothetical protein